MNLALFDLDNTLLAGDSDYQWTSFLTEKGILDREAFALRNDKFLAEYNAGTLDIFEFLDFQLQPFAQNSRADLERWRAEFVQTDILPMISSDARALVKRHVDAGDLLALVTATNSFVVAPIAREFGISHLIATIPAQNNGEFTGKPRGLPSFREGKITRVEAWLESLGFWWTSFEESWFYSDSLNDLPLLQAVSHPVAVNPDPALLAHATSAAWPILNLHP